MLPSIKSPSLHQYAMFQDALSIMNTELFNGILPHCMITMQREARCLGYFHYQRFIATDNSTTRLDEIAINPQTLMLNDLMEVLQTLAHEQCHQWQYHSGKPSQRSYHNREWADKMESIGLMPSSTGHPGGKRTGQKMSDYLIPDGLFEKCAKNLIKDKFRVPWADRQTPIGTLESLSVKEDGVIIKEIICADAPSPKKKVCYSHLCGEEKINLWGKPGVKICCETCGQSYRDN